MSVDDTVMSEGTCDAICAKPVNNTELDAVKLLNFEMEYLKTVHQNLNYSFSEEEMLIIKNEAEIELNKLCSLEFYDFCIITCDADYEEALSFRSDFCKKYNLKGCMLLDASITTLGGDIFSQYETMIERSTKVFFYHTENYKKDSLHLRVQNGAVYQQLWETMRWNREKCVPVFPHGRHKLGLALSGVSGLDPTIPGSLSHRVQATFTENVRKIRVLKERNAEQKRHLFYKDLIGRIVQKYVKRKLSVSGQDLDSHWKLKINDEKTSPELRDSVYKMVLSEENQNEIIKAVTQSISSKSDSNSGIMNKNVTSAYDVTISDSSEIHVGPRIELNIHLNTSNSSQNSSFSLNSVNRTENV
ncbi:hypothetical protein L9F63_028397 [Diploptera punctata]|uniref:Uncharacterized protein n=1 Tax=Diploptera punctata TaxID=6984 RepID=A0AAD7ZTU7_DIPPU|nr:hypothetical protein L9F63_028397 [Diploptera punctata]